MLFNSIECDSEIASAHFIDNCNFFWIHLFDLDAVFEMEISVLMKIQMQFLTF